MLSVTKSQLARHAAAVQATTSTSAVLPTHIRRPQKKSAAHFTTLTSSSTPVTTTKTLVPISSSPSPSTSHRISSITFPSSSAPLARQFHSRSRSSHQRSFTFPRLGLLYGAVLTLASGVTAYVIYRSPAVHTASDDIPLPAGDVPKKKRRKRDGSLRNPGPFNKYHEDVKNVCSIHVHSGGRFTIGRNLAYAGGELTSNPAIPPEKYLQVAYSVDLGNPHAPGGIQALQIQSKLYNAQLQGSINHLFHSNGGLVIPFRDNKWIFKSNWQINGQQDGLQLELEYAARSSYYTLQIQNLMAVLAGANIAVTNHWSVGAELIGVPLHGRYGLVVGTRYKTEHKQPNEVYTINYNTMSEDTTASYIRQLNENTSLATEFLVNWRTRESQAILGMQHQHMTYQFNAAVNSEGTVSAMLENRLSPQMAFGITGEMNHVAQESTVGISFNMQV